MYGPTNNEWRWMFATASALLLATGFVIGFLVAWIF